MIFIENQSGIHFNFHYKVIIRKAVETVMKDKDIPEELDVNVMIVDPDTMRGINNDTRGRDSVTDILSFPYFEYEEPGCFDRDAIDWSEGDILGDIVVCGDRIISQAEEYGHSQKRELAFLVVHSMLHITGYDHMEPEDAQIMETEQRRIMDILGIHR
ncbi:MAG: rRNA maturation RNase YbeY [Parasporobacterium sp.]|nr:rRNA maturation RNase YbeY [Parasporobacterium sp.]